MFPRFLLITGFSLFYLSLFAQEKFTIKKDLRAEWMIFDQHGYKPLSTSLENNPNTVYFRLEPQKYPGDYLRLKSDKRFFLFVNGKVTGQYEGQVLLSLDSITRTAFNPEYLVAIHQRDLNRRDLITEIISMQRLPLATSNTAVKPLSDFRDFVVVSGLIIIVLFLVILHVNPKLAADYFSVARIFSAREAEDSQSSARLTSSSNVQFYILCSLMIGFYLLIILQNLPPQYALPIRFQASGFWMMWWQWLKLSTIIFYVFLLKILIIFSLTRLFNMRGMARFHFFNWIRLLLIVFGAATIILFMYFISRGDSANLFVVFLSFIIIALIGWIVVAFFKLSGRSEHSMFHLFSYICATEIIPLLITVKLLFQ